MREKGWEERGPKARSKNSDLDPDFVAHTAERVKRLINEVSNGVRADAVGVTCPTSSVTCSLPVSWRTTTKAKINEEERSSKEKQKHSWKNRKSLQSQLRQLFRI